MKTPDKNKSVGGFSQRQQFSVQKKEKAEPKEDEKISKDKGEKDGGKK